MTPCRGNTTLFCSSQQLPPLPLAPLKGFLADTVPFKGLDLPCSLVPELQRNKVTVRYVGLDVEVPGHCEKQLTQICILLSLKMNLCTPILGG